MSNRNGQLMKYTVGQPSGQSTEKKEAISTLLLLKNPKCKWAGVTSVLFLICLTIVAGTLINNKQKQGKIDAINNLYNLNYFNTSNENLPKQFERLISLNTSDKIILKQNWLARPVTGLTSQTKFPIKYVIICHTSGRFCNTTQFCTFLVQWIQNCSIDVLHKPDTFYNFFVGGGNIYESRGWHFQNDFIDNSITISMIGNFVFDELTEEMVTATQELLEFGVNNNLLDKNYKILAHNQTKNTISPGNNVYKKIVKWSHYSPELIV